MKNTSALSPASLATPFIEDAATTPSVAVDKSDVEKRMLLYRLSDAASRIREETDLIRRTGFNDNASRLLRILSEAVEEQRAAHAGESK